MMIGMITILMITTMMAKILLSVDDWVDKVSKLLRDDDDGDDDHDNVMATTMTTMTQMMMTMMKMIMMMRMLLPADDWLDRVSRHSDGLQGAPTPVKRVISTKPNL